MPNGFPSTPEQKPLDIARAAIDHARRHYFDVLLVDTAGRLAIDEALMNEIKELHAALNPVETLFVVDAMQGQDAVNTAKAFKEALPLTGIVLTKLDGDSRGGAALSVRQVTGAPIKFAGVSEKIDGLEVFDAERHAGRVLGMGDIVALVEQVSAGVDLEAAQKLAAKVKSGDGFDLNDFLGQLQQMKQMGGISSLMDKLPSELMAKAGQVDMNKAEKDIRRKEGIIQSMTPQERRKPEIIKATRKKRIAAGAGVQVQEVNRLLNEFDQMQGMMKKMKGGGLMKMMKKMGGMKGFGGGRHAQAAVLILYPPSFFFTFDPGPAPQGLSLGAALPAAHEKSRPRGPAKKCAPCAHEGQSVPQAALSSGAGWRSGPPFFSWVACIQARRSTGGDQASSGISSRRWARRVRPRAIWLDSTTRGMAITSGRPTGISQTSAVGSISATPTPSRAITRLIGASWRRASFQGTALASRGATSSRA